MLVSAGGAVMYAASGATDEDSKRTLSVPPEEQAKMKSYFGGDADRQARLLKAKDRIFTAVDASGQSQAPGFIGVLSAAIYAAGPLLVNKYVMSRLARDKQARELKLKKEQPAMAANPMAQIMMRLQKLQEGGDEDSFDEEPMISDSAAPVDPKELEWNPDDILSPGKRRFFAAVSWLATLLSIVGVVNLGDTLKDQWRGNTISSAMHHQVNEYAVSGNGGDNARLDKMDELATLETTNAAIKAAQTIKYPPLAFLARWWKFNPDLKKN